jgi:hypothetical protein
VSVGTPKSPAALQQTALLQCLAATQCPRVDSVGNPEADSTQCSKKATEAVKTVLLEGLRKKFRWERQVCQSDREEMMDRKIRQNQPEKKVEEDRSEWYCRMRKYRCVRVEGLGAPPLETEERGTKTGRRE